MIYTFLMRIQCRRPKSNLNDGHLDRFFACSINCNLHSFARSVCCDKRVHSHYKYSAIACANISLSPSAIVNANPTTAGDIFAIHIINNNLIIDTLYDWCDRTSNWNVRFWFAFHAERHERFDLIWFHHPIVNEYCHQRGVLAAHATIYFRPIPN